MSGSVDEDSEDRLYKGVGLCVRTGCTSEWVCGWGQAVQVSGHVCEDRLYK